MNQFPIELILSICSYFDTLDNYNVLCCTNKILKNKILQNLQVNTEFYMKILKKLHQLYTNKMPSSHVYCFGGVPRDEILKITPTDGDFLVKCNLGFSDESVNYDRISDDYYECVVKSTIEYSKKCIPSIFSPTIEVIDYIGNTSIKIEYILNKKTYSIDITFEISSCSNDYYKYNIPHSVLDCDINSLAYKYIEYEYIYEQESTVSSLEFGKKILVNRIKLISLCSDTIENIKKNIINHKCNINMKMFEHTKYDIVNDRLRNKCSKRIFKLVNKGFNIQNMTKLQIKEECVFHENYLVLKKREELKKEKLKKQIDMEKKRIALYKNNSKYYKKYNNEKERKIKNWENCYTGRIKDKCKKERINIKKTSPINLKKNDRSHTDKRQLIKHISYEM
jgi:hypothetical protein